jgi:hypothetical protein
VELGDRPKPIRVECVDVSAYRDRYTMNWTLAWVSVRE